MLTILCALLCLAVSARAQTQEDELAMIRQIEWQRLAPRSLTIFVNSADPAIRAQAAQSLGRIGSPGGLPPLRMLLTDPVPEVRMEAAFAMGLVSGGTRSLVHRLKEESHPMVRARIVQALGRTCEKSSCVEVVQWAMTEEPIGLGPSPIGDEATLAIGRMAYRDVDGSRAPSIVTQLLAQLSYSRESTRQASAFALESMRLSELPDAMAARLFDEASTEPDPVTQALLIRATSHLQGHPSDQTTLYSQASQDPDTGVRIAVARAASDSQWSGLVKLLHDPDPGVRRIAIRSTSEINSLDHRALLMPFLDKAVSSSDPTDHVVGAEALSALYRSNALVWPDPQCGGEAAKDIVDASVAPWSSPACKKSDPHFWSRSEHPSPIRLAAIEHAWNPHSLAKLAQRDPNPSIRLAAANTLMQDFGTVAHAQQLLRYDDPLVSTRGALYLSENPTHLAEAALVEILESAANPRLVEASAMALGSLYSATPALPTALDPRAAEAAQARLEISDSRAHAALTSLLAELGPRQAGFKHTLRVAPGPELRDITSVRVSTTRGELIIELFPEQAPLAVASFVDLVEQGYYDGLSFHRVEPDFIIATGDPSGDGTGSLATLLPYEPSPEAHRLGTVSMALKGPDTAASQWFITLSPQPLLDGHYTRFGQVISGKQYLHDFQPGDQLLRLQLERVSSSVDLPTTE